MPHRKFDTILRFFSYKNRIQKVLITTPSCTWYHFKGSLSCVYIGDIQHDIAGIIARYLLTLANRYDPISVTTPKVAKGSTIVPVACHCRRSYHLKYNANVYEPQVQKYNSKSPTHYSVLYFKHITIVMTIVKVMPQNGTSLQSHQLHSQRHHLHSQRCHC